VTSGRKKGIFAGEEVAKGFTARKKTYIPRRARPGNGGLHSLESLSICRNKSGKEMEIVLVNIAAAVIYGMIAFNSMREGRQAPPRVEEQ
jgi:hypothetical protein